MTVTGFSFAPAAHAGTSATGWCVCWSTGAKMPSSDDSPLDHVLAPVDQHAHEVHVVA